MRRPRANEGGREEEERRPEIAAGGTGCPHDRKKGDEITEPGIGRRWHARDPTDEATQTRCPWRPEEVKKRPVMVEY
jgi:hypothetical protein